MRINLNLNEKNDKDKKIIDLLESRYNAAGYIKELLYQAAMGNNIYVDRKIDNDPLEKEVAVSKEIIEEYEEIKGLDNFLL